MDAHEGDAYPASLGSPIKIGVWVFHIRRSNGTPTNASASFVPAQTAGDLNTYFAGLFEFIICGESFIDSDELYYLDLPHELPALNTAIANLNVPASAHCVRLFFCGEVFNGSIIDPTNPSAYTYNPVDEGAANSGIFSSSGVSTVLAHEMGHYFHLPHAFVGPQYVDDVVNINGVALNCQHTGDMFCDTRADGGPDAGCVADATCKVTCTMDDPLGVPFDPDPTLLMSYYFNCMNRFTGEQKTAMRIFYAFHPNYNHLRPAPLECLLKYGVIERTCDFGSSPMVGVSVIMEDGIIVCNPSPANETDANGLYDATPTPPCNFTYDLRRVFPNKNFGNNYLNGVNTNDLKRISFHILGTAPLATPYQMIAADANNSGTITMFDILELRKLILGASLTVPAGSWRYVPKLFTENAGFASQFFDNNPFDAEMSDPFTSLTRRYKSATAQVPNGDSWMDHVNLQPSVGLAQIEKSWSFTGLKVGDVNCDADIVDPMAENDPGVFVVGPSGPLAIPDAGVRRIQVLASTASASVSAWQLGARYSADSLTVLDIGAGNHTGGFDADNFYISPTEAQGNKKELRAIWYPTNTTPVDINGKVLFEFTIRAEETISALEQRFVPNSRHMGFKFYGPNGERLSDVSLSLRVAPALTGQPVSPNSKGLVSSSTNAPFALKVFPTVFTDQIDFIATTDTDEEAIDVFLYDQTGRQVAEHHQVLVRGENELVLSGLNHLAPGLYVYAIRTGAGNMAGKLIKN